MGEYIGWIRSDTFILALSYLKNMKEQDITTGFQHVDQAQADYLIKLLGRISEAPAVQECLQEQLRWLDIRDGFHILDVGCGIGYQAFEMAKRVGRSGKVIGTDMSEAMVEVSKQNYAEKGVPLTFQTAFADKQPFKDGSFDRVRTERVLLYVPDLDKTFNEFYRLLKPAGKVLAFDVDMEGLLIAHPNKALTRQVLNFISDSFPNGRIGIELPARMQKAGFNNIQVKHFGYMIPYDAIREIYGGTLSTGVEKGVFKESDIATWWNDLASENQQGGYLASQTGFLAMGTK